MDGVLSRRAWVCPGAARRSSIFTVTHNVTLCSGVPRPQEKATMAAPQPGWAQPLTL